MNGEPFCPNSITKLNKAGYTAQDAPSMRTFHRGTDGPMDGRTDRRMDERTDGDETAHLRITSSILYLYIWSCRCNTRDVVVFPRFFFCKAVPKLGIRNEKLLNDFRVISTVALSLEIMIELFFC